MSSSETTKVLSTVQIDKTTFLVVSLESGYALKATGRINCFRPIQLPQIQILSALPMEFILQGDFTIVEDGNTYIFESSTEGWLIKCGERVKQVTDETVGEIISCYRTTEEVFEEAAETVLISAEAKGFLTGLSAMLDDGVLDAEVYERARKHADETGDERVKDMLRIVEKRFRKISEANGEVKIHVIE